MGVDPSKLDTSVISRIPVRTNRDTRYFNDKYQGMPSHGYTKMCENMLENKNIKIMLNTNYKEVIDEITYDKLIYTGSTDEFYNYKHGRLAYRSIDFVFETYDKEEFQEAPVVNYPNDYDYTRITEFKNLHHRSIIRPPYAKSFHVQKGNLIIHFQLRNIRPNMLYMKKRWLRKAMLFSWAA